MVHNNIISKKGNIFLKLSRLFVYVRTLYFNHFMINNTNKDCF